MILMCFVWVCVCIWNLICMLLLSCAKFFFFSFTFLLLLFSILFHFSIYIIWWFIIKLENKNVKLSGTKSVVHFMPSRFAFFWLLHTHEIGLLRAVVWYCCCFIITIIIKTFDFYFFFKKIDYKSVLCSDKKPTTTHKIDRYDYSF